MMLGSIFSRKVNFSQIKNRLLILVFTLFGFTFYGQGRQTNNNGTWNFFLKAGSNFSQADIKQYNNFVDFNYTGFEGRIGVGYYLTPWLNTRIEGGFGSIKSVNTSREVSFSGNIIEGASTLNFNLSNLIGEAKFRKYWINIYGGIGFGAYKAKQFTYELGMPPVLINEIGQDKRENMNIYPIGFEINYAATKNIDFHLGYRHTFTNTDKLDVLEEGNNDSYSNLSFGLTYKITHSGKRFNSMKKCDWTIKCEPKTLIKEGKLVKYKIVISFPPNYFNKNAVICLQPILYFGNNKQLLLDQIHIGGEDVKGADYIVTKKGKQLRSSGSFLYTEEMKSAKLYVAPALYQYKGGRMLSYNEIHKKTKTALPQRKIADGVRTTHERYLPINHFASVVLDDLVIEPFVINFIRNTANINYNSRYPDEESLLSTIAGRIKVCNKNPVKFIITSYASPEGEKQANMILSERRSAKALSLLAKAPGVQYRVQFLTSRTNIELTNRIFDNIPDVSFYYHDSLFKYTSGIFKDHIEATKHCELIRGLGFLDAFITVFKVDTDNEIVMRIEENVLTSENIERIINKGADWEGLGKVLDKGKNLYSEELNEKLKNKKEEDKLFALNQYYKEKNKGFDKEILSDLRKTEIQFNCQLDTLSTDSGHFLLKDEYDRNPSQLTENQLMYLSSKQTNDEAQLEILSYLLNKFPNYEVARINMAAIMANNGRYNEAQDLLNGLEHSEHGAFWYNKGILALNNKEYDQATVYLNKANEAGINTTNAQRIIQINTKNINLSQIVLTDTDQCNYNTALLFLINNKPNKAHEILKCAKDNTGNVYYLKAIVAARLNNKANMLLNLSKAIAQKSALKEEAKMDIEFLKYREDSSFKKLLN